jgi:hypothetical protein
MPRYLAEIYVPQTHAYDARLARPARSGDSTAAFAGGRTYRYVRTTLLPGDETCFYIFDAASEHALVEACRLACVGTPRIVRAVE